MGTLHLAIVETQPVVGGRWFFEAAFDMQKSYELPRGDSFRLTEFPPDADDMTRAIAREFDFARCYVARAQSAFVNVEQPSLWSELLFAWLRRRFCGLVVGRVILLADQ